MRFVLMFAALTLASGGAYNAVAQKTKVTVGGGNPYETHDVQIRDLMKRVSALEVSNSELQRRVNELEGQTRQASETGWNTCIIETPFDGTFSATEPTRTGAIAKTVEACKAKAGNHSIYCGADKVTCGK